MFAATLADRCQVGFGKSIVPDKFIVSDGKSKQAGTLGRRQHTATWHGQSSVLGGGGEPELSKIPSRRFQAQTGAIWCAATAGGAVDHALAPPSTDLPVDTVDMIDGVDMTPMRSTLCLFEGGLDE